MSDPDKRYREPPLTLDKRRAPKSRGPAPVTLIVSVLILIVGAGGIVWLYRGGVRGAGDQPPTVGAPADQGRTAAPPEPAAPDAAAGLSIYKDNGPSATPPAFAPPPEAPVARPAAPTPAPETAPAPAAEGAAAKVERKAPPAPKAKSEDQIDTLLDQDLGKSAKPTKAAKPAQVAKAAPAPDTGGPLEVQIGAFSSKAQADEGWSAAAGAAPGDMAGRGKRVVATVKDGKTLYRTSITGFASRQAAEALCARLKAAGRTCFVR